VVGQVNGRRRVGFPAVGKLRAGTGADQLAGRVIVEQLGDSRPATAMYVPVAGSQDAQPPRLEVQFGRVMPAGQWVEHDGNFLFGALEAIGSVDLDLRRDIGCGTRQRLTDMVSLIAVRDADRYAARPNRLPARVAFARGDGGTTDQPCREGDFGRLAVGADGVPGRQFGQCQAV